MLLLGILLLAAAGTFTGLVVSENLSGGPEYTVMLFGESLATLDTLGVFLAGIGLALVFCAGLALVAGAARRRREVWGPAPGEAAPRTHGRHPAGGFRHRFGR
ncbi:hypothetical protein LG634_05310 [Streptomyces bambusae]|uniref:hypothetical protein n=1 Tax=Streptomyces bambusae TaxID=1550616 RepID=UPI001CFE25E3|nr:hypothetical protein [Streptomyces bambusae]MCB5164256.1 hypothetical protein [Streptomyces bambusae]